MGIASWLLQSIQAMLAKFATTTSAAFLTFVVPIAGAGITIYIILIGLAIARGQVQAPVQETVLKIFKMVVITSLLVGTGAYSYYVIGFFEGIRDGLLAAIGSGPVEGLLDALGNDLMDQGTAAAKESKKGMMPDFVMLSVAFIYWAVKMIMIICGMLPLLISTVVFYMSIAIGPIFIACLLFPVTAKYFDSWLGTVLVAIFTNVAVALILAATTEIFRFMLNNAIAKATTPNPPSSISIAVDVAIVGWVLAYMAWKAGDFAAQWVGGSGLFNPMDKGFFAPPVNAAKSGAAAAGRGAYSLASRVGKMLNPNSVKPGN